MSLAGDAPGRAFGAAGVGAARTDFGLRLERLRDRHPLKYVKLGTEVEALTFEEIAFTREVVPPEVPVWVKIGGPGAVNDVRAMARIGVQGLIGPMIESTYGLANFVQTVEHTLEPAQAASMAKGINLETLTCWQQFDAIAADPAFASLDLCNVGRSDLASSMGRPVTDPEVRRAVGELIRKCHARGMAVHVGGQVTGATLESTLAERPDGFHTRFLAFALAGTLVEVAATVDDALELELAYLKLLEERFPAGARLHRQRRRVTGERLEEHRRWAGALARAS